MRYLIALLGAALLAVTLFVSQATASTPTPVTINGHTVFGSPGTFTTSGAGLCASGSTYDDSLGRLFATGFQSGNHVNFHDLKTFVCDDGSGTFTADLQVMEVFGAPSDSYTWVIMGGTGAYTSLHGTGTGVGLEFPGEVYDTFTGSVHFDS